MLFNPQIILYLLIFHKLSSFGSSVPRDYGEIKLFDAPVTYDLNTTVSLHDDKQEIGYNMRATVRVEAAGSDQDTDFLLKFHLSAPSLAVGGRAVSSHWAARGDSEFFAEWSRGRVPRVYMDPGDPPDVLNFKIAVISLFQFQVLDGEVEETDISGSCHVSYETLSMTDIRKTKRRCGAESASTSAIVSSRYSLAPSLRSLRAVRLEERLDLGLGLRAAARLTLEARGGHEAASPASSAAGVAAALRSLPAALAARRLEPADDDDDSPDDHTQDLEAALAESSAALSGSTEEAGGGGRAVSARAALRLLAALRAAAAPALLAALRAAPAAALPALCRALGRAATPAAHTAADRFLGLAGSAPPPALAAHYLAGCALAPRPAPAAVRALLQLASEAREAPVAAHALLAAAAAAPRVRDEALVGAVRDAALRGLARCKDDECRALRLHALGNLRPDDVADVLLEHVERGGRAAALAAVDALAALPAAALHGRRLLRLEGAALRAGRPLEVRAAAVDLVLRRAAAARLAPLSAALRAAPVELRRVLWQRAAQLSAEDVSVAAAWRALPAADRSLAALLSLSRGTSAVLSRPLGWEAVAGRAASLEAVQVAAAGLLRRATVALHAGRDHTDTGLELEVSVWTLGLDAVAGSSPDELAALDEDPQHAAADAGGGLALVVGGVRAPGITLFTGQAELLSHVWAGTGSTPTPVLRSERALPAARGRRRLAAGGAVSWRGGRGAALALDAHAQVSLWSRGAKLALELRAATYDELDAELSAPAGPRLQLAAREDASPTVHVAADLDFYDGVALCVRAHGADHRRRRNVTAAGPRRRRHVHAEHAAPARTLALGRPNDHTCRTLGTTDD